jgi:hypothetical protein
MDRAVRPIAHFGVRELAPAFLAEACFRLTCQGNATVGLCREPARLKAKRQLGLPHSKALRAHPFRSAGACSRFLDGSLLPATVLAHHRRGTETPGKPEASAQKPEAVATVRALLTGSCNPERPTVGKASTVATRPCDLPVAQGPLFDPAAFPDHYELVYALATLAAPHRFVAGLPAHLSIISDSPPVICAVASIEQRS